MEHVSIAQREKEERAAAGRQTRLCMRRSTCTSPVHAARCTGNWRRRAQGQRRQMQRRVQRRARGASTWPNLSQTSRHLLSRFARKQSDTMCPSQLQPTPSADTHAWRLGMR
eukprot:3715677-Rhodomonas_salina.2